MINYGLVHSVEKPKEIQIIAASVFVASNITPYEEIVENHIVNGYEYNYIQYDKDEYIQAMANENKDLKEQVLTTQEAICELYEMLLDQE